MLNVSHKSFIVHTNVINRTNVDDTFDPVNLFKSFAPSICNGNKNCKLNNAAIIMTIGQLQTTNYDRFLLLRSTSTGKRFVTYILTPHDSLNTANYLIPTPGENYAWMMFEENLDVTCVENLVLESYKATVTYIKSTVTFKNSFTLAPAVFGMVMTFEGRDGLGLRGFNIDKSKVDFITQEDKCTNSETNHETEEMQLF